MLVATALAMTLLGHARAGVPALQRYATGGWTLTVISDRFTGATSCSVRSRAVTIRSATAIFQLDRHTDTDQAQFRIDGGAAHSVQDVTLANAHNGVFPERGWVTNPSGGEVALPLADVENAKLIWIRDQPGGHIKAFDVSRLDYVLRSAVALGCPVVDL